MSLFRWATPERRSADRILPIIPNEIYLHVFEQIAHPTGRLIPEQLRIFTNLSGVCRFFANVCLPRIFEYVEFCGSIFRDDKPIGLHTVTDYKPSRGSRLCAQIAAKQPLALALAKTVRICCFKDWYLDETGSWAVRLFAAKYIAGMLHMTNIRRLWFFNSFVDAEHWSAIATLGSLEELFFNSCKFLQGPAGMEPEERVRVKASCLRVHNCAEGFHQPIAGIDVQHLRSLLMDFESANQVDWDMFSALTELYFLGHSRSLTVDGYIERLHAILGQPPQSLETLELMVDADLARDVAPRMFNGPAWQNLALLRSLTLHVPTLDRDTILDILSSAVEGIGLLTNLRSLVVKDFLITSTISTTEIQRILHDKLSPVSTLQYLHMCRKDLRLVDGKWEQSSSGTR